VKSQVSDYDGPLSPRPDRRGLADAVTRRPQVVG
jgi:hypothetical protein